MKILNLYAGIGGNRKLWGDEHEVTAVEYNEEIAKVYKSLFPNDKIIIADAHQFLLEHFWEFDLIWSSPPCPSHSRIRKCCAVARGQNKPVFPNMGLYEEILFLKGYFKGLWIVENVIPWYDPLMPAQKIGSHLYWANFKITDFIGHGSRKHNSKIKELAERKGFANFDWTGFKVDKRLVLRNCVEPEFGLHILNCAMENKKI